MYPSYILVPTHITGSYYNYFKPLLSKCMHTQCSKSSVKPGIKLVSAEQVTSVNQHSRNNVAQQHTEIRLGWGLVVSNIIMAILEQGRFKKLILVNIQHCIYICIYLALYLYLYIFSIVFILVYIQYCTYTCIYLVLYLYLYIFSIVLIFVYIQHCTYICMYCVFICLHVYIFKV